MEVHNWKKNSRRQSIRLTYQSEICWSARNFKIRLLIRAHRSFKPGWTQRWDRTMRSQNPGPVLLERNNAPFLQEGGGVHLIISAPTLAEMVSQCRVEVQLRPSISQLFVELLPFIHILSYHQFVLRIKKPVGNFLPVRCGVCESNSGSVGHKRLRSLRLTVMTELVAPGLCLLCSG